MERRKLMRPLDDYIHSITQTQEEVSKKTYFYNSLRHFYRKKWGCPLKVPSIHGVELDLHLLYETVISLGGWSKVSNHERWPQVLHKLGIDEDVQVAEYAVRMLYMRFLVKYEQAETGNDPDEHDSDLMAAEVG
uniref:ARID domain-containing protein n=1 Tax=Ditylenchus dipsaci TaxID=166011 RepID=A0A915DLH4_9BILA